MNIFTLKIIELFIHIYLTLGYGKTSRWTEEFHKVLENRTLNMER